MGQQLLLNLGQDFERYMMDQEFHDHVNSLVDVLLEQIWRDLGLE